jgi:tRNA threonylcarbamoyl adenosine modification protein (Sua5/YciO/YrdC/YwlC family)
VSPPAGWSGPLTEALAALSRGDVVAVPTDTVYGLAVDPRRPGASERIYAAKGRPDSLALPVLVSSVAEALELAAGGADELRALAAAFWPGPLTVVVPLREDAGLALGGDGATVGLRLPDHPMARELLVRSGPLAVTSANLHGQAPLTTAHDVRAVLGDRVAVVVDGGACTGAPSTVVRLSGARAVAAEGAECLREGAIAFRSVRAVLARLAGAPRPGR